MCRWAVRSWQAASDLEPHMRGKGPLGEGIVGLFRTGDARDLGKST